MDWPRTCRSGMGCKDPEHVVLLHAPESLLREVEQRLGALDAGERCDRLFPHPARKAARQHRDEQEDEERQQAPVRLATVNVKRGSMKKKL